MMIPLVYMYIFGFRQRKGNRTTTLQLTDIFYFGEILINVLELSHGRQPGFSLTDQRCVSLCIVGFWGVS